MRELVKTGKELRPLDPTLKNILPPGRLSNFIARGRPSLLPRAATFSPYACVTDVASPAALPSLTLSCLGVLCRKELIKTTEPLTPRLLKYPSLPATKAVIVAFSLLTIPSLFTTRERNVRPSSCPATARWMLLGRNWSACRTCAA